MPLAARRPALRRLGAVLLVLASVLAACTGGHDRRPRPTPSRPPYSQTPNVVFVLTDDLSSDLVRYMPHIVALQNSGMTFTNYTVTDSLCCPSRASIFTGRFPHNTHVRSNGPRDGGMAKFNEHGGERASFGYRVSLAGYRTALFGKYLNGYEPGVPTDDRPRDYVPPGWSDWGAGGHAYKNFDYLLNENGRIVRYGAAPQDYLTNVVTARGEKFIGDAVRVRKPFLLELATYSPHSPFTPDPRDAGSFLNLRAPRDASFNKVPRNAPKWMQGLRRLTPAQIAQLDSVFVRRVEAVQSVDRAVGRLETALRRTGQLSNTVFVFSSDNGFHLGQHGLRQGKRTAFDTDVRVPLVIAGPGIRPGSVSDAAVQNIDLAPTFEELSGMRSSPDTDGRSLVPLLHGRAEDWRTYSLVEHKRSPLYQPKRKAPRPGDRRPAPGTDPDEQPDSSGNPPTYTALRTDHWTYVRYADGAREFYDRRRDPYETVNLADKLGRVRTSALDRRLAALTTCRGAAECWSAGVPRPLR